MIWYLRFGFWLLQGQWPEFGWFWDLCPMIANVWESKWFFTVLWWCCAMWQDIRWPIPRGVKLKWAYELLIKVVIIISKPKATKSWIVLIKYKKTPWKIHAGTLGQHVLYNNLQYLRVWCHIHSEMAFDVRNTHSLAWCGSQIVKHSHRQCNNS